MAGKISHINYPAVWACMELLAVKKKDRKQLFIEMQIMESAVLNVIDKK